MLNNKFLELLRSVSEQEMKEFSLYMKKNFQKTSVANRLLTYINKYHPALNDPKLNKRKVHAAIFKKEIYNDKNILNAISDLRKEFKRYLLWRDPNDFLFEKNLILLQFYKTHNLDKHFDKHLLSMNKKLEKETQKDMWHWLREMQLSHEYYFYRDTKRITQRTKLSSAMKSLDQFYAASKLRYSSELYNGYQVIQEKEPDILFLKGIELMDWSTQSVYHSCYKIALQMIRERKESHYLLLKELFFKHNNELKKEDQYIFITYLLNHTSYEIRKGRSEFVNESFELIKFGIRHQIFIIDGVFDATHFLNAIEVSGQLNQFDWAKQFIKKWTNKLEPSSREYLKILCKALIEFRIQNFESCSELLIQIDMKEPQDQIRGRWLAIISHYEIGTDTIFILNLCTAFEKFIRRNKFIHEKRKKGVLLSIKVLRMLMNINPDKAKIEEVLNSAENFHYKSWLTRKLEDI